VDKIDILEPVVDPTNKITFLVDWILTLKCNLDCSYCGPEGHDNSTSHPPLDRCKKSVDFMLAYTDLYMRYKVKGIKHTILNVLGGESLHHPNIVEILAYIKQKHSEQEYQWPLTLTCTSNVIVSSKKLQQVTSLIDEFTTSFHAEATEKQHTQFKKNLLSIKQVGKRLKCIIVMHNDQKLFNQCLEMIEWCKDNDIKYLPKQIDNILTTSKFNYNTKQIYWFESQYQKRSHQAKIDFIYPEENQTINLAGVGRACCGGRQMCTNEDRKQRFHFLSNVFPDWYCSVNEFFVHINQSTEEIFTNKDCRMSFNGDIGPIGNLNKADDLIKWTEQHLENNTLPVIQCKKNLCFCGLCAPKAKTFKDYQRIMEKYHA
jgi:molybdenum cofactor biosynthesis enzyme MoaA